MKKIVFFVMSKRGFYSLQKFLAEFGSSDIDFVVTSPDKNMEQDFYTEIRDLCLSAGVRLYDKNDKYSAAGKHVFLIGWRWMLNSTEELYVFHDSILPRYRGYSALVNQLLNREERVGVTSFYSEKEYDSGDIIGQLTKEITYPIRIQQAIDDLCPLYYSLLREICVLLLRGESPPRLPQDKNLISYSVWRDEKDYRIDWSRDSGYLRRFIDTVGFPYKGAAAYVEERKIRITDAQEYDDCLIENRSPGKVMFVNGSFPVVICGKGLLKITAAYDDLTRQSILPLKKLRTRFE